MAKDLIRYDLLVQDALKGAVRKVLGDAAKDGLPGEHHFYISFRTDFPGVRASHRLRDKYPQEMTIVLQHQFWDLGVTEHAFEVGLSFSGVPERLLIPFDALTGFFDPSVQFGLKFEVRETGDEDEAEPAATPLHPVGSAAPQAADDKPKKPALPVAAKTSVPKLAAKPVGEADKGKPSKPEKPQSGEGKTDGHLDAPPNGAEVVRLDTFRKKT